MLEMAAGEGGRAPAELVGAASELERQALPANLVLTATSRQIPRQGPKQALTQRTLRRGGQAASVGDEEEIACREIVTVNTLHDARLAGDAGVVFPEVCVFLSQALIVEVCGVPRADECQPANIYPVRGHDGAVLAGRTPTQTILTTCSTYGNAAKAKLHGCPHRYAAIDLESYVAMGLTN
jgi:hypothetical protein